MTNFRIENFDGSPFDGSRPTVSTTDKIRFISKHAAALNEWERGFIANVRTFIRPTDKQVAIVDKLYDKLAPAAPEDF